jgi:hypothetical protein
MTEVTSLSPSGLQSVVVPLPDICELRSRS